MQSELAKSIRDAEKGFYPLGPLLSFKHTMVRRKTAHSSNEYNNQDLEDQRSEPNNGRVNRSSYLQSTSQKDPFGDKKKSFISRLVSPQENSYLDESDTESPVQDTRVSNPVSQVKIQSKGGSTNYSPVSKDGIRIYGSKRVVPHTSDITPVSRM